MISTATAIVWDSALSQGETLGAIAVAILIILLIAKELLSSYESEKSEKMEEIKDTSVIVKAKTIVRNLNVIVYPLLFLFALIVCIKIIEVL